MADRPEREPRWLSRRMIDAMHADQLRQHGGSPGVRDDGLVESALARPKNRYHYSEAVDLADLASAYAAGLAKNHGFVDGNKRIGFVALYVCLGLKGLRLTATEPEAVRVMTAMAAGMLTGAELATWVRDHVQARG